MTYAFAEVKPHVWVDAFLQDGEIKVYQNGIALQDLTAAQIAAIKSIIENQGVEVHS